MGSSVRVGAACCFSFVLACGSTSLEVAHETTPAPLSADQPTLVVALPSGAIDPQSAQRSLVTEAKQAMAGWQVTTEGSDLPAFTADVYYLDSKVERQGSSSSVEVKANVLVSGYPARNLKMILRGSARASGFNAEQAATQGAFTGALRGLPAALTIKSATRSTEP